MWKTTECMQVEQLVSDRYKEESKDRNKNNWGLKGESWHLLPSASKILLSKKITWNLLICKNLLKYNTTSTSGVSQLPCCTCQCGLLPASVEAAQENAPHSSSLAKHSGPGPTGSRRSSGPCPSRTPYTWPHCPWCKVCKSIPSERKGIWVGACNHSDNPLPASLTLPLKTLQTTIQGGGTPSEQPNLTSLWLQRSCPCCTTWLDLCPVTAGSTVLALPHC